VAKFDLKAYARQGAAARVAELNEEIGGDLARVPRTTEWSDERIDYRKPLRGAESAAQ
jgi:hypothetical protein